VASYNLLIKASAARELEALPAKDRSRIAAKIEGLANNPRPPGSEKLCELSASLRKGGRLTYFSGK